MSRRSNFGLALVAELVTAACESTGAAADSVAPAINAAVEYLQRQYGGTKLYIPKLSRKISMETINRMLALGVSRTKVARKFGISRRTLRAMME